MVASKLEEARVLVDSSKPGILHLETIGLASFVETIQQKTVLVHVMLDYLGNCVSILRGISEEIA